MKRETFFILRTFLYWLLLFFISRGIFLLYYFTSIKAGGSEIPLAFYHSLPLDISTASYLMVVPFLLSILGSFFSSPFSRAHYLYTAVLTVLYSLITSAELCLYAEWGTKLHYKALTYLVHPSEVLGSATWMQTFIFIISFTAQVWGGLFLYRTITQLGQARTHKPLYGIYLLLLFTPLLILGIRGGTRQIPVNQSDCYYSSDNLLNLAAVNSGWNLLHSITENPGLNETNPYQDIPAAEALKRVTALHMGSDSTLKILNTTKPNIVFIILESWSADLIPSCGGDSGATGNFEALVKQGLLFNNVVASGDRSDQGMAAIYSGFPAQPLTTIIAQPSKFQKLPALGPKLKAAGYHTSYYFGGQLSYGNIKSYMMYNQMDKIIDIESLPDDLPQGKLGIHDGYMLDIHLKEISGLPQPFFTSLFTLSTHSPFDMPMKAEVISWGKNENPYVNSMYYADSCLGEYFKKASKEKWFSNTLFVLVSDHGRNSHRNHEFISPDYHKIPMLFFGEVIKEEYRGKKVSKLVSQTDLPATLLTQLEIDPKDFKWSRNALDPLDPAFAYYSFINGVGWVTPEGFYTYDYNKKAFHHNTLANTPSGNEQVRNGKSYLQVMFNEYLSY